MRLNMNMSMSHSEATLKRLCLSYAFKNACMRKVIETPRHVMKPGRADKNLVLFGTVNGSSRRSTSSS
jgi:hypothetical protein